MSINIYLQHAEKGPSKNVSYLFPFEKQFSNMQSIKMIIFERTRLMLYYDMIHFKFDEISIRNERGRMIGLKRRLKRGTISFVD